MIALYIHIPFCQKTCPYCAFYKTTWDAVQAERFLAALEAEMGFYQDRFGKMSVGSLFLGGGTPSRLEPDHIRRLGHSIHRYFDVRSDCEISAEMNPESVDKKRLDAFVSWGVNRASLGVQSFVQDELDTLGRTHKVLTLGPVMALLRNARIRNINLDLMFGLPGSTVETVKTSLDMALSYAPTHLSTYALAIETGTPFHRQRVQKPSSDAEYDQYMVIRTVLTAAGFGHYEVSCFSQPGFECRHNMAYWTFAPYVGLGPGAHSYFEGYRYQNRDDLVHYIENPVPVPFRTSGYKAVDPEDLEREFLIFGLRLRAGISLTEFENRFHVAFLEKYQRSLMPLMADGFVKSESGRLSVTDKGLNVLDSVLARLI